MQACYACNLVSVLHTFSHEVKNDCSHCEAIPKEFVTHVATSCEETLNACGVRVRPHLEAVDVEPGSTAAISHNQTVTVAIVDRFYYICEICIGPTQRKCGKLYRKVIRCCLRRRSNVR